MFLAVLREEIHLSCYEGPNNFPQFADVSLAGGGQGPRDVRPRPPLLLPGALSPGAGPRSGQLSLC